MKYSASQRFSISLAIRLLASVKIGDDRFRINERHAVLRTANPVEGATRATSMIYRRGKIRARGKRTSAAGKARRIFSSRGLFLRRSENGRREARSKAIIADFNGRKYTDGEK